MLRHLPDAAKKVGKPGPAATGQMNCNLPTDQQRDVVVAVPDFLKQYRPNNPDTMSLDTEIADTILELWRRGIVTLSSCSGHGTSPPGIVVTDTYSLEGVAEIRRLLGELDPGAQWDIHQWRIVKNPDVTGCAQ